MTATRRLVLCAWLVIPALALAVILAGALPRVRHVEWVSRLGGGEALAGDPHSPTGYTNGARALIAPEHDARSKQWIVQAQEMVARGSPVLDHVDYDNAPVGRAVRTTSPYRWWLAFVGWLLAATSGLPLPAAIERAALWADPALQIVLLLGLVLLLLRSVGVQAAAWGAAAVAGTFPFAAQFLPGRPDELGLALILAVFSVAPLAVVPILPAGRRTWPWFALAGAAGGAGLAVSVAVQMPVLIGTVLAALAARRNRVAAPAAPDEAARAADQSRWRLWAMTGGTVALAAWIAESLPDRFTWSGDDAFERNHPAYILAWLGMAEVLSVVDSRMRAPRPKGGRRMWAHILSAVAAIAVLPVGLIHAGQPGFLGSAPVLDRLTDVPADSGAASLAGWIAGHGVSLEVAALLLPLVAAAAAAAWVGIRARARATREFAGFLLALGPLAIALGAAGLRPGYAAVGAAMLFCLIGPLVSVFRSSRMTRFATWSTGVIAATALAIGALALAPRAGAGAGESVSPGEAQALIERDFAWWLARQAPEAGAVVLAPPELTVSLIYFGGLRGLGTPYPENEEGFRVALRLSSATSAAEGQALAESRRVRYIVVPSWDDYLDEYARIGTERPENALITLLHRWQAPRWLRPVPYLVPQIEGLKSSSVAVFEVVEVQDNPTALARLGEFFLQTGRMAQSAQLAATLKEHFPAEPAAWIARAQIAWARRDALAFREALEGTKRLIEDGAMESLPWDLRVRLALILASGREQDLARTEAERCVNEMDTTLPRTLSNITLRQFLDLLGSLGLEVADSDLRGAAESLLPVELRQR